MYKCKSGDKIIGQWKDGLKHGPIEILYQNGDHFKGQFRNDCIDGKGEFKCKNGFHYNGEWKMNLVSFIPLLFYFESNDIYS